MTAVRKGMASFLCFITHCFSNMLQQQYQVMFVLSKKYAI